MKITFLFTLLFLCAATAKAQWAEQNAGFTGKTLGFYEISIVNENVVWAICYDGVNGLGSSTPILEFTRTTNGGATWTPGLVGNDTSLAFSNICALSDTEAWVAMHKIDFSTGGGLFHTTDGGATWQQSNPGVVFNNGSFPNFVYFKDALHGIAGGDANGGYFEIYTTSDGGINWTRTPQANIPEPLSGGQYGWFDGYAAVGDTVWFGTNLGQMYKSTDFGQTWTVNTVDPAMSTVYEIAFNDDGLHGLTNIRTPNNTVILFSTTDGGVTWTQMAPHPNWKRSRVTSVPGTSIFVSTSVIYPNRGSSYTTDNGATWIIIDSSIQKAACRFLNSTTGWAGGYFNDINPNAPMSGGLWKFDNTVPLGIVDNEVTAFYISPNPVADVLNISVGSDLPLDDFRFYNSVGALVMEVSNSNGESIDVSGLSSGVYLIKSKNYPGLNQKFIKL
ncbi:MAG TPA: T9SS type A sorting domain-containing protein [Flavobacterium sp.]